MLTRPIPSTGEALPVIGLGTYRSFDVSLTPFKKKDLQEVLRMFFAAGGTVIDSSPMYGKAEAVTGKILESIGGRDRAFVATKVWTSGRQAGIKEMNDSLDKLKCASIELMQVHNLVDCRTHLETLREWQAADKIKYIGITHYTDQAFGELASYLKEYPWIDFCQFPFSIGQRDAEDYFLDLCADHDVATLINRPLDQDRLFKVAGRTALPEWAGEIDCHSWSQFFLKYLLSHPAVTCVIPATGNPDHMADNLKAGEGPLPGPNERKLMADIFDRL